jgi:hypothetical protein
MVTGKLAQHRDGGQQVAMALVKLCQTSCEQSLLLATPAVVCTRLSRDPVRRHR